jgi:hypothetical protein
MKSVQDFQSDIERFATAWGEALKIGNHKVANKLNNKLTKIAKEFKGDKTLGESVLTPLLKHPNPSVRLIAAVHALDQEVSSKDAEKALTEIANDPNIRVIRLTAKILLTKNRTRENSQSQYH